MDTLDLTERCLRCGFCSWACPSYREERKEPFSPRGRVFLLRSLEQGKLESNDGIWRYLDSCLDCLACSSVCPSGVEVAAAVTEAKARLRPHHPPPLTHRLLLNYILPQPWRQRWAALPLRFLPRPGSLGALPSLPRSLRPKLPALLPAKGERRYRVGFFLGCAQDILFPSASAASIEVLRENGAEVVFFPGQRCCGKPFTVYGEPERAKEMAAHNLSIMAEGMVDAVVTDCATCASFLRSYPELLKETDWAEESRTFGDKVMEISQFLSQIPLREVQGRIDATVTYHDPCHLGRGLKVKDQPRLLLRAIPGLRLVEMKESDSCCGGAGTYAFRHPHLSAQIREKKIDRIRESGADLVATSCPACRLQISWGLKQRQMSRPVLYPTELLLRAYRQDDAQHSSSVISPR